VLVSCWSAKGGSGTTVVAVALASLLARRSPAGALLADLAGDVPAVLGLPEPPGPGLGEWLAADDVPADALGRLEVAGPAGLRVLPTGVAAAVAEGRGPLLAAVLAAERRAVVADCGSGPAGAGLALALAAPVSLLVLRPCYLALRRALRSPVRPSGIVLVREPGRALGRADVEDVLGVRVVAQVAVEPAVARAVDAGLVPGGLPRALERALREVA
jgi:hypothetical protein